jgi:hypothetical protein
MHPNKMLPESNINQRFRMPDHRHPRDGTGQPEALSGVNVGSNRHVEHTQRPEREVHGYQALILDRIEHLLRPGSPRGSSTISTPILPGVFKGFDLILGAQGRTEIDLEANRLSYLHSCNSEVVAAARRRVTCDLMIRILRAFDPYEHRAGWFLSIVNDSLDTDTNSTPGDFIPDLSEPDLRLLFRTLCVDLRFAIIHSADRCALADKYGHQNILIAEKVLDELWRPVVETRRRLMPFSGR